jgi:hypothetical protein
MGAIELAASHKKITLPPGLAVDAQINLNLSDGAFFLTARLDVSVPGVDREAAVSAVKDKTWGSAPNPASFRSAAKGVAFAIGGRRLGALGLRFMKPPL